jgi:hypothetical protein
MKEEIEKYIDELKNKDILQNIPIEFLLPNLPLAGPHYNEGKKILFLGQDVGNISNGYDNVIDIAEKEKAICEYNNSNNAFDFENSESNFIVWYSKYHYYFWELPIRIALRDKIKKGLHNYQIEELLNRKKELQSFAWGNVTTLIFPHYLKNNILSKEKYSNKPKFNLDLYHKAFEIEQSIFNKINFYSKYLNPDYIIVLTPHFKFDNFFQGIEPEKKILIENVIDLYSFKINGKEIQLFWTYHPSFLRRKKMIDEVCQIIIGNI